jgi:citrate lyase subunit beta/citryl-CoA lyase
VRSRLLVECVAAGVVAVDAPYTYGDLDGLRADTLLGRRLGYHAKTVIAPGQVATVAEALTPSPEALERARRLVAGFDGARAAGRDRVEHEGALVDVPTYLTAKRLIARAEALAEHNSRSRH